MSHKISSIAALPSLETEYGSVFDPVVTLCSILANSRYTVSTISAAIGKGSRFQLIYPSLDI